MKFNINKGIFIISCSACSVMSFSVAYATNLTNSSNLTNPSSLPKCDTNNITDIVAKGGCSLGNNGRVVYKMGVSCNDINRGKTNESCQIVSDDKFPHGYIIYPDGGDSNFFVLDDKNSPKVPKDFNFECGVGFEAHIQDTQNIGGSLKCVDSSHPKCLINPGESNPACSDAMKVYASCNHQFPGTTHMKQYVIASSVYRSSKSSSRVSFSASLSCLYGFLNLAMAALSSSASFASTPSILLDAVKGPRGPARNRLA